jgi:hypothetical protein
LEGGAYIRRRYIKVFKAYKIVITPIRFIVIYSKGNIDFSYRFQANLGRLAQRQLGRRNIGQVGVYKGIGY